LLPAGSAWFAFPTVRNWSYTYLENADRSRWDKRCTVYRVTARPTNRRPWGNKRNHPHHHCLIFCTPTKPATHWPQVEESTRKASMEPSCTGVLSQMNVPIVDIGSERSDVLIGAYSYFSLIEEISAWSFYHADVLRRTNRTPYRRTYLHIPFSNIQAPFPLSQVHRVLVVYRTLPFYPCLKLWQHWRPARLISSLSSTRIFRVMAHPLAWPGKYFFYPVGNTSAVCLTRDLAPEEPANIFLLGCGDPRNVLYTIFCEPQNSKLP